MDGVGQSRTSSAGSLQKTCVINKEPGGEEYLIDSAPYTSFAGRSLRVAGVSSRLAPETRYSSCHSLSNTPLSSFKIKTEAIDFNRRCSQHFTGEVDRIARQQAGHIESRSNNIGRRGRKRRHRRFSITQISQQRRWANERERNRTHELNEAILMLKARVPDVYFSRVRDTKKNVLCGAIDYIQDLSRVLEQDLAEQRNPVVQIADDNNLGNESMSDIPTEDVAPPLDTLEASIT